MEGQKTVPMSGHFILFITPSVLIRITYSKAGLQAKMKYYDIGFLWNIMSHGCSDMNQSLQNSQTLGQFFEPLYMVTQAAG